MNLDTLISVVPTQMACNLANEKIILETTSGIYYNINSLGKEIWELIQTPLTVSDILDSLTKTYNVSFDQCKNEVISFLLSLQNSGLIKAE